MSSTRRVKKGPGGIRSRPSASGFMELRERGLGIIAADREVGLPDDGHNWSREYRTYRHGQVTGLVQPLDRLAVRQISPGFLLPCHPCQSCQRIHDDLPSLRTTR